MGNDGGSIPDRRDLVRTKPKAEQADKNNQVIAQWFFCALSKRPLQEPIVSCGLGKLYNKDALLEYLLDKSAYGDGEEICGHIKSIKDVTTLKFTPNPAKPIADADPTRPHASFICPLTLKEMSGTHPFVYLASCGCVFSSAGLRALSSPTSATPSSSSPSDKTGQRLCPNCAKKYDKATGDMRTINPSPEEQERMRAEMDARRAAAPVKIKKKRKADNANTATEAAESDTKKARSAANAGAPSSVVAVARSVTKSLEAEEKKRKEHMSAAVASLYKPKGQAARKETFTTMGTFTRYA